MARKNFTRAFIRDINREIQDSDLKKHQDKNRESSQDLLYSDPLKALGSYGNFDENLIDKDSSQEDKSEEGEPDYMRVKELFSYENFARMHREIE